MPLCCISIFFDKQCPLKFHALLSSFLPSFSIHFIEFFKIIFFYLLFTLFPPGYILYLMYSTVLGMSRLFPIDLRLICIIKLRPILLNSSALKIKLRFIQIQLSVIPIKLSFITIKLRPITIKLRPITN